MGNAPLQVGSGLIAVLAPTECWPRQNAIMVHHGHVYHVFIRTKCRLEDNGWRLLFLVKKIITGKFRKDVVAFHGKLRQGGDIVLYA